MVKASRSWKTARECVRKGVLGEPTLINMNENQHQRKSGRQVVLTEKAMNSDLGLSRMLSQTDADEGIVSRMINLEDDTDDEGESRLLDCCCFLTKGSIPHKPGAEKMRQTCFSLVA